LKHASCACGIVLNVPAAGMKESVHPAGGLPIAFVFVAWQIEQLL